MSNEDSVWVAELVDNDQSDVAKGLVRWSARFSGYFGIETIDQVSAHEAVAWGRKRSSEVHVRVGSDTSYSAGRRPIRGLPEWPEGSVVEPRFEKTDEYEWRNRTEDDLPVDWDVAVSPSAPPFTNDPHFDAVFIDALAESEGVEVVESGSERHTSTIAIRVQARTVDEAQAKAQKLVLPAFHTAMRQFTDARFGWVMEVDPRPAK